MRRIPPASRALPRWLGPWARGERGAALVEFTLVLPMLLALVCGIVDFGRLFQSWITITNAAREGARLGATHASSGAISARVITTTGTPGSTPNITVTNAADQGGDPGESVVVRVSTTVRLITPLGPMLRLLGGDGVGNQFTLTSTADMRLE